MGDYVCTAKNREGVVTATTRIIVAGPAMITGPPRNLTKLEGDKTELVCITKALPSNVTYRWFHNGTEVTQLSWLNPRASIKRDGTLFVNPTTAEDMGRFTCEVSNGIGQPDTASAFLSVECKQCPIPFRSSHSSLVYPIFPSRDRSCARRVLAHDPVPAAGPVRRRALLRAGESGLPVHHVDEGPETLRPERPAERGVAEERVAAVPQREPGNSGSVPLHSLQRARNGRPLQHHGNPRAGYAAVQ